MCSQRVDTTTLERLAALLSEKFKLDPSRISPEQPLDQLGIDSLGMVELLFFIEDDFQVKLPSNPPPFATVGDAVRYIDGLLATQRPARTASGVPPSTALSDPASPAGSEAPSSPHPDRRVP